MAAMMTPIAWARSLGTVTTSFSIGDVAAQRVTGEADWKWDAKRTLEFAAVGLCVMGPTSHLFESAIERTVPGTEIRAVVTTVLTRVTVAPCFLSLSFGSLAFLRGRDVSDAICSSVWPAWKTGTLFWPAVSLATYRFVPVHWRPAVGSCVGAVWSTYLSFVATEHEGAGRNTRDDAAS